MSVRGFSVVALAAAAALLAGCIIEDNGGPPADTAIEFGEVQNLGYSCGGPLTSWTVTAREISKQGTAGCQQPVLFPGLTPGANYTFDITGYDGQQLCWQGSCQVTAVGGTTTWADCSSAIAHLCGN